MTKRRHRDRFLIDGADHDAFRLHSLDLVPRRLRPPRTCFTRFLRNGRLGDMTGPVLSEDRRPLGVGRAGNDLGRVLHADDIFQRVTPGPSATQAGASVGLVASDS